MNKFIVVTAVNDKIAGKPVHVFCAPIRCNPHQEKTITDRIESRKIDLDALIDVMLPDTEEKMREEAQAFLDSFQEIIKECKVIIVAFLNSSQMEEMKRACRRQALLENMSGSQDIISKN